ncbi:MAG: nitrile hydratase accessory protein [Candidatus Binataceae bacterium]
MAKQLGQLIANHQFEGDSAFREPWEARVFALVLSMAGAERIEWEGFRQRLIAEIARDEAAHERASEVRDRVYYHCWLRAFEDLLGVKRILDKREIDQRADEIAASPPAPSKPAFHGFMKVS